MINKLNHYFYNHYQYMISKKFTKRAIIVLTINL